MIKLRRVSFFVFSVFLEVAVLAFFSFCLLPAGCREAFAAGASGCVTGQCHSGINKDKFVHGPVAIGACLFCHRKTGTHKFKPVPENISGLCYQCHDRTEMVKTHPPVKATKCTVCHSPHHSRYKYMLRSRGGQ